MITVFNEEANLIHKTNCYITKNYIDNYNFLTLRKTVSKLTKTNDILSQVSGVSNKKPELLKPWQNIPFFIRNCL